HVRGPANEEPHGPPVQHQAAAGRAKALGVQARRGQKGQHLGQQASLGKRDGERPPRHGPSPASSPRLRAPSPRPLPSPAPWGPPPTQGAPGSAAAMSRATAAGSSSRYSGPANTRTASGPAYQAT